MNSAFSVSVPVKEGDGRWLFDVTVPVEYETDELTFRMTLCHNDWTDAWYVLTPAKRSRGEHEWVRVVTVPQHWLRQMRDDAVRLLRESQTPEDE